jgi:Secretion system C-terminal sorting domain
MRTTCLILFLILETSGKLFSQSITISGNDNPNPGAQEYYEAQFDYSVNPYANLSWSVSGGTIISESINPTLTVWCIVEWDNTPGTGSLSLYEDINGISGDRTIQIGQTQDPCASANAGNDVTICSGGSTIIGTSAVSGYNYAWFPATGLNNPSIAQPTANPSQTTTYTLTMNLPNLLQNGDFENGFTGFSTDYNTYPNGDGLCGSNGQFGSLTVNTNPLSVYSLWCNKADHSPIGNKMLIVDASCGSNKRVWYETVSVSANTDYFFSGWAGANSFQSDASQVPLLRVRINGVDVIQNFSVPIGSSCDNWLKFSASWNSGSSTNALIEIYDDNLEAGGNDFSLDDLYFANCEQSTDQVTVTVGSNPPSVSPAGPITYYNQYETTNQVTLTCNSAPSYQWYKNNTAISGATNQTYTINFQGLSIYTDYYKVITSCGTSNTVTFNYVGCNGPSCYPVSIPSTSYCASSLTSGNYIQLNAPSLGVGTSYNWWLQNNPTCYSISSSGHLTESSCSPYQTDGVYTKSSLSNGTQTYMYYVIVVNTGCRTMVVPTSETYIMGKTKLIPNPAILEVTISSSTSIQKIEIYNMLGSLVKRMTANGSNSMTIRINDLKPGIYSFRALTNAGVENLKLIIQR